MNPTPSETQPRATFKALPVFGVVLGSIVVGVGLGAGVCVGSGWGAGQALVSAAIMAGVVWMVAGLLGAQALIIGTGLSVDRMGMGVLVSSTARMLAALMLGLLAFFMLAPDGRSFWVCFLGAGLSALVAETIWAMRTINGAATGKEARGC